MPRSTVLSPEQAQSEERLRTAILSHFVISGLDDVAAAGAAELVAGLVLVLVAGHRLLTEGGAR